MYRETNAEQRVDLSLVFLQAACVVAFIKFKNSVFLHCTDEEYSQFTCQEKRVSPITSIATEPYDVLIVGAGPAGATAAYYLAQGTAPFAAKRVALLEKAIFPRDKYCGDAWCAPALDILEEMQVLQRLEAEGLVQDTKSGGFVSPSGESFISTGGEENPVSGTRCYAIQRVICDERIARRAVEVGAELFENTTFARAKLESDGYWTVQSTDRRVFRARILIAADGATSQVARSLGVLTTPPQGIATRQYVEGGTHNFKSGGVLLYPKAILPGYIALFRHYNDDIDVGCYAIPGGAVEPERLVDLYENELKHDPFLRRALGPHAKFKERVRVASLRLGGVEKSSDTQLFIVGDAAGQTDPLTGEGIHTGMIGGKLAAQTIHELFAKQDFSAKACAVYHARWMQAFGKDFAVSALGGKLIHRFPLFLDAANRVAQRKGEDFMAQFGAVMTGVKPKSTFLQPKLALPLGTEALRQFVSRKILRRMPSETTAYQRKAADLTSRATAFRNACLIDPNIEMATLKEPAVQDALCAIFRHAGNEEDAQNVWVLYATEYGFARELAQRIAEKLTQIRDERGRQRFAPLCLDIADFALLGWLAPSSNALLHATIGLFLCSTAGDGVPPQRAQALFQALDTQSMDLQNLHFSVLALGDRAYPNFCRAGRDLEIKLQARGAKPLFARSDIDREDWPAIEHWMQGVAQSTQSFLSTLSQSSPQAAQHAKAHDAKLRREFSMRASQHFANTSPPQPGTARDYPLTTKLIAKRWLCTRLKNDDPEILHLEIAASDHTGQRLVWQPGDSLGVWPQNSPTEVEAVLAQTNCKATERVPSHAPLGFAPNAERTLRDALLTKLDIKTKLQDILSHLCDIAQSASGIASESTLAEEIRKSEISAYLAERELQDILHDFPHAARTLDAETLCRLLHPLHPRYYSIASSASKNPSQVDLCVAIVRYELHGRLRTGLASTFLADRIQPGDSLAIFVQPASQFRLPESDRNCILIGAGTGVAPYRAFLQELEARKSRSRHWLFLGCRHERHDFVYSEEWRSWEKAGLLQIQPAFSRDQAQKVYVQDRLLENAAALWKEIQAGSYFYICGDASQMATGVHAALQRILVEQGAMSPQAAHDFLTQMEQRHQLQKDVWSM